ncbi:hypothetical protein [Actinomadura rudentiformis]|uniref:Uncharacterized protein n=1 Tax=Actinomadura rudentiformis TaxID=359158 RepID=A0A6H9Z5I2_9ACTN|nr:hypothetical protein [Actinomadura rudentiformis]KAB2348923.1 hypothetical protein F8566_14285 [Actinomadura rudentiformis]
MGSGMAQGRRRFRRFGSTTTAVSAGALVLVFLGAPAAYAGTAAAPKTCKKGTDPKSTIENWKCQLGNWRESLTPKKPQTTPKPSPSKKPPLKPDSSGKGGKSSKGSGSPGKSGGDSGNSGQGQQGSGPATLSQPGSVRPYTPSANTTPNLPGVLPTPEVAADPRAYMQQPGTPQTRLISPVAASERQDGEVMWVAAAAGAAGAVGALNLSVLGRRLRRRAESGA